METDLYPIKRVLFKVLVLPFYLRMSLFYFLIVYFGFGLLHPEQIPFFHTSLVLGIFQDSRVYSIMVLVWILYDIRFFFYVQKALKKPENEFLLCLAPCFNKNSLFLSFLISVFWACLPFTLYLFFTVYQGFTHGFWFASGFFLGIHFLVQYLMAYVLSHNYGELFVRNNWLVGITLWVLNRKKSPFSAFLYYLFLNRKFMLLITKIISLALLFFSLTITKIWVFDEKVPVLFLIIAMVIHYSLVKEIFYFDSKWQEYLRNVPYSLSRRYWEMVGKMVILFLPEIILFLVFPVSKLGYFMIPECILIGLGTLFLYYTFSLMQKFFMNKNAGPVFFLFILEFVLNLYSLWIWMGILAWISSIILYFTHYYSFEGKAEKSEFEWE